MTTIPTGPEHINRKARVLEDVRARNDGHTQYEAGEIVRVMDVRPAPSFGGTPNQSVGFRRVTIASTDTPGRRAAATSANNLELLPTAAELADATVRLGARPSVSVSVHAAGAGGGGGASWAGAGGGVFVTSASPTARTADRRNAKEMDHAHTRVAAAYRELTNALDALKSLEARP